MTTRTVSARSLFATMHTNKVTWCANWLVGLEPKQLSEQSAIHMVENGLYSHQNKTTKDKWQKWRKDGRPSQTDVIFVVMDALVNVLVGEVLILHCHENGDCHAVALRASSELSQSADCQSVRSRDWSELLQSAGDYISERSRVVRPNSICTLANLPINPRSVVGQKENLFSSPQTLVHSQAGETSAKIDSQRFTTETRWIIMRSQIRQRLSQRAMLPRQRASEMDCRRVRLCHKINRVQSDRRVRSSQSNFIKVRHMTEKSQHRVSHVVLIIFTRTTT